MASKAKITGPLIDPRVSAMFRTQPKPIQFLAAMLCAILGAEKTAALVDVFAGRDVDWTEVVAGRPLRDFNGKNARDLRNREGFTDDQIQAIRDAYTTRGLSFPETDAPDAPPAGSVEESQDAEVDAGNGAAGGDGEPAGDSSGGLKGALAPAEPAPGAKLVGGINGETSAPNNTPVHDADSGGNGPGEEMPAAGEPTIAGHPFSELRGKSDIELLQMPGIGRASLARVRAMEAEEAGKAPDGGGAAPDVAPAGGNPPPANPAK